ncbi:hypothetical protein CA13_41130 [Planctomycetes bacterium CA13]|uniref:3-keto-alpha-glucoside-1,2-lyase/3-keto-2-hydroxy-glucal hydratase domain-containing protein n=1 Tax=Novipirellula herctigrandis TaxID=2527986 RepID=A0A5C5Z648_9BACT|nr:hypothetical protein CA13_41130 [Planctomycetes bacterium CA13]
MFAQRVLLSFALMCIVNAAPVTRNSFADDNVGQPEAGFVSMFNGKDLMGWKGQEGVWRVEDDTITGESVAGPNGSITQYLYYEDSKPADFIMRFEIKLRNNNSGVQFRSETRPNFDTNGYQADFDETNEWTGCLFQHGRGAVVTRGARAVTSENGDRQEERFATMPSLLSAIKTGEFNDYEIEARGSKIKLRLNGTLMCEVDDRDAKWARRDGIIALQIHQGDPMKVQFRNLRMKVISEDPVITRDADAK